MTWQVWGKVLPHADWADARATATVWDAEGLVQVQVADVGTDDARRCETQLRIHVGTIHVDLTTILVDDLANLLNIVLEESTS